MSERTRRCPHCLGTGERRRVVAGGMIAWLPCPCPQCRGSVVQTFRVVKERVGFWGAPEATP
jgi:DnaJ-class molecular chaperone